MYLNIVYNNAHVFTEAHLSEYSRYFSFRFYIGIENLLGEFSRWKTKLLQSIWFVKVVSRKRKILSSLFKPFTVGWRIATMIVNVFYYLSQKAKNMGHYHFVCIEMFSNFLKILTEIKMKDDLNFERN